MPEDRNTGPNEPVLTPYDISDFDDPVLVQNDNPGLDIRGMTHQVIQCQSYRSCMKLQRNQCRSLVLVQMIQGVLEW